MSKQRGYALPEVLIATAIAAGVLTATATAAGGVVRLNQATSERARLLEEAKLIASRLHGGMDEQDAIEGLDGWRLTHAPYEELPPGKTAPPFEIVTASFGDNEGDFVFQTLVPSRDGAP